MSEWSLSPNDVHVDRRNDDRFIFTGFRPRLNAMAKPFTPPTSRAQNASFNVHSSPFAQQWVQEADDGVPSSVARVPSVRSGATLVGGAAGADSSRVQHHGGSLEGRVAPRNEVPLATGPLDPLLAKSQAFAQTSVTSLLPSAGRSLGLVMDPLTTKNGTEECFTFGKMDSMRSINSFLAAHPQLQNPWISPNELKGQPPVASRLVPPHYQFIFEMPASATASRTSTAKGILPSGSEAPSGISPESSPLKQTFLTASSATRDALPAVQAKTVELHTPDSAFQFLAEMQRWTHQVKETTGSTGFGGSSRSANSTRNLRAASQNQKGGSARGDARDSRWMSSPSSGVSIPTVEGASGMHFESTPSGLHPPATNWAPDGANKVLRQSGPRGGPSAVMPSTIHPVATHRTVLYGAAPSPSTVVSPAGVTVLRPHGLGWTPSCGVAPQMVTPIMTEAAAAAHAWGFTEGPAMVNPCVSLPPMVGEMARSGLLLQPTDGCVYPHLLTSPAGQSSLRASSFATSSSSSGNQSQHRPPPILGSVEDPRGFLSAKPSMSLSISPTSVTSPSLTGEKLVWATSPDGLLAPPSRAAPSVASGKASQASGSDEREARAGVCNASITSFPAVWGGTDWSTETPNQSRAGSAWGTLSVPTKSTAAPSSSPALSGVPAADSAHVPSDEERELRATTERITMLVEQLMLPDQQCPDNELIDGVEIGKTSERDDEKEPANLSVSSGQWRSLLDMRPADSISNPTRALVNAAALQDRWDLSFTQFQSSSQSALFGVKEWMSRTSENGVDELCKEAVLQSNLDNEKDARSSSCASDSATTEKEKRAGRKGKENRQKFRRPLGACRMEQARRRSPGGSEDESGASSWPPWVWGSTRKFLNSQEGKECAKGKDQKPQESASPPTTKSSKMETSESLAQILTKIIEKEDEKKEKKEEEKKEMENISPPHQSRQVCRSSFMSSEGLVASPASCRHLANIEPSSPSFGVAESSLVHLESTMMLVEHEKTLLLLREEEQLARRRLQMFLGAPLDPQMMGITPEKIESNVSSFFTKNSNLLKSEEEKKTNLIKNTSQNLLEANSSDLFVHQPFSALSNSFRVGGQFFFKAHRDATSPKKNDVNDKEFTLGMLEESSACLLTETAETVSTSHKSVTFSSSSSSFKKMPDFSIVVPTHWESETEIKETEQGKGDDDSNSRPEKIEEVNEEIKNGKKNENTNFFFSQSSSLKKFNTETFEHFLHVQEDTFNFFQSETSKADLLLNSISLFLKK